MPLGRGRIALIVGDVVGHGAPAVAVMGQLRTALIEALMSGFVLEFTGLGGILEVLPESRLR